ncbi:MAG: hypothetical protein OXL41_12605, partial [Nitrospinae bacterium]|nr:hypothetical protein [Nitrospinota bacterium]
RIPDSMRKPPLPFSPMPTHALEIAFPRRAHDSGTPDSREHGKCGEMRVIADGGETKWARRAWPL